MFCSIRYHRRMALGMDYGRQDCSLARALEVMGERWSLLIVRDAFYGVTRFNDFLCHLEIPRAVLTTRLRRLVAADVFERRPYQLCPTRYDYVLTRSGRQLWLPVYGLAQWGLKHASDGAARILFSHATCGTRLDAIGACPACCRSVAPEDVLMSPGPGAADVRHDPVSVALREPHRLLTPLELRAGAPAPAA